MLDLSITESTLFECIKSIQTKDPCVPKIHPDLLISGSNLAIQYLQGVENVLTPEKIYNTVEEFYDYTTWKINDWASLATYNTGDIVKYDDGTNTFYYVALQGSTNETPSWDSTFWETNLSSYLRTEFKNATKSEVQNFIAKIQSENDIADVMNLQTLMDSNTKPELKQFAPIRDRFFGVQFQLSPIKNIQIKLSKIGLYCQTAQTLPIYLYHSSQPDPVATFTIDITAQDAGKFVWKEFNEGDVILNYIDNAYNTKGRFYLGFYEDDIIGDYYQYEWRSWYASSYPDIDYIYCGDWKYWFTQISPFETNKTNKPQFFDLGERLSDYTYSEYLPFNLQLCASCNYTYFIEECPEQFCKVVAYYASERILRSMLNSIRRNEDSEFIRSNVHRILLGELMEGMDKPLTKGIVAIREDLENSLQISLHELDDVCFAKGDTLKSVF